MGPQAGVRAKYMRAIHAEAKKRKLDHDALRDILCGPAAVKSLADVPTEAFAGLYRQWTGKGIKHSARCRHKGEIEQHQLVSAADLEVLMQEFAKRQWGPETQQNFIARQLRGRRTIVTRGHFFKVLNGVRAINRRENLTP